MTAIWVRILFSIWRNPMFELRAIHLNAELPTVTGRIALVEYILLQNKEVAFFGNVTFEDKDQFLHLTDKSWRWDGTCVNSPVDDLNRDALLNAVATHQFELKKVAAKILSYGTKNAS